jgi:hypothetical protein
MKKRIEIALSVWIENGEEYNMEVLRDFKNKKDMVEEFSKFVDVIFEKEGNDL